MVRAGVDSAADSLPQVIVLPINWLDWTRGDRTHLAGAAQRRHRTLAQSPR